MDSSITSAVLAAPMAPVFALCGLAFVLLLLLPVLGWLNPVRFRRRSAPVAEVHVITTARETGTAVEAA